ncbi:ATP-independent periplasmic protein-refolding chaperone Spy [Lonsdalea quercina]|uniref:ATP-independent periplasmic protein-refolding chaperone Spy n=1 Tax=Lonsdalea quercina TaxID=71657 RepID=UPI003975C102
MSKLTAIVIASALAFGAAGFANAQDTKPAMPHGEHMMKHHGSGEGMEHGMMFKGLNLTADQKQKIHEIMESARKDAPRPAPEDRTAMHDVIAADSFDTAKAESVVDKMEEASKARTLKHLETQNKIYNVLTPEQKKQFNANFEKRLAKGEHAPKPDNTPKAEQ